MVVVTVAISRFGDGSQLITAANLCLEAVEGSILQVMATLLKLLPMDLIKHFYCVNTSYPMDNCFTGRRDRSRQTSEEDVLYIIPAGLVRRAHSPGGALYFLFLSRQRDVIASFSFGAWRVKTCFHDKRTFCSTPNSTIFFNCKVFRKYYLQLCRLQDREEVPAGTLWLGLITPVS